MTNDKFIMDAGCGGRFMWDNKDHPNTLYIDNRTEPKGINPHRPNFEVRPDKVMDWRSLDMPNKSFKLILWDPPHSKSLGKTSRMRLTYGSLGPETWANDLSKGFKELWRVLDDYGTLVFKWNQSEIKLKDVLALFPVRPLFGDRGSAKFCKNKKTDSNTRWSVFMKIPDLGIGKGEDTKSEGNG